MSETGPAGAPRPGKPNGDNGNGQVPLLPRWFALKGPRPYWLAENWSFVLSVLSTILVLLNTVVTLPGISPGTEKWVNAVIAWIAAAALFLQGRQKKVTAIAKWRAQIRTQEKTEPGEEHE